MLNDILNEVRDHLKGAKRRDLIKYGIIAAMAAMVAYGTFVQ